MGDGVGQGVMRLCALLCVVMVLVGCAAVQPHQVGQAAPVLRDWFSQAELEAALLANGLGPEDGRTALCSEDPARPGHYWGCVQYDGRELLHYWWVATWDEAGQRVEIRWQSQVEVQF